jgi:hypothetical protein
MAYGQNAAWGFLPIRNLGSSTWNGQTTPYLIQSGYANNIFKGDLVYLGSDGFLHNLSDQQVGTYPTFQSLGVFWGASFQTSTATNPIDPASPGRSYWPAGTVTLNSVPAQAFVIDDPNIIFNIQSDAGGVPFNAQGATASISYSYVTGSTTNPTGNTITGNSLIVLNSSTIATAANLNVRIRAFVPVDGNVPSPANVGVGIPYNNVEVLIQNHSLAQRAVGL